MPTVTEVPAVPVVTPEAPKSPDSGFGAMMKSANAVLHPVEDKTVKPEPEIKESEKEKVETAPDVAPATDKAPPETKPDGKVSGIAEVRKQYESIKAEKLKLEEELKTFREKKPPEVSIDDLNRYKKERDDALKIVERVDRQRHPGFQKEFVEPLNNIIKKARQYVPAESHPALEVLLKEPPSERRLSALETIIEGLSPARQSQIMTLADSAENLISKREDALAEADGWWKEQQEKDRDQARDAYKKNIESWEREFESVKREASDDVEMFRFKDGDEEHNRVVSQRLDRVKALVFGESSNHKMVQSAFAAVAAQESIPLLARANVEISKRDETIADLQKQLEDLRTKRPGISTSPKGEAKPKNWMDAIHQTLKGE